MIALFIIWWAVIGGIWRRMLGGWAGLPRSVCYGLSTPLSIPVFFTVLPLGVWWASAAFLSAVALSLIFFVVSLYPGGRYDNTREVLLKYGPFGLGYVMARRYIPSEWAPNDFFDGWASVGEVFLGASFYACVGLFWLI